LAKSITYQFNLFGYQVPKLKVPISKARIQEAQRILEERNGKLKTRITPAEGKLAELILRDVREGLENYLSRLR